MSSRHIDVVVGAIIEGPDGKILLIKQKKWGSEYTCFVGGRVKPDERIDEALKREIYEETSLRVTSCERLSFGDFLREEDARQYTPQAKSLGTVGYSHAVFLDYFCRVSNSHFKLNNEIQEAQWVEPGKALELVVEKQAPTIKMLIEQHKLINQPDQEAIPV